MRNFSRSGSDPGSDGEREQGGRRAPHGGGKAPGWGRFRFLVGFAAHRRCVLLAGAEAEEDSPAGSQDRGGGERSGEEDEQPEPVDPVRLRGGVDRGLPREQRGRREAAEKERASREEDEEQPLPSRATVQLQLVDRTVPVQQRARADEESAFHEPMSDRVERRSGDTLRAEETKGADEDPHVAHGGEGEEPLQVPLREAEQGASGRGERAEPEEDRAQVRL